MMTMMTIIRIIIIMIYLGTFGFLEGSESRVLAVLEFI